MERNTIPASPEGLGKSRRTLPPLARIRFNKEEALKNPEQKSPDEFSKPPTQLSHYERLRLPGGPGSGTPLLPTPNALDTWASLQRHTENCMKFLTPEMSSTPGRERKSFQPRLQAPPGSEDGSEVDPQNPYPPKGNALVRNPFTGKLERREGLETRYQSQKEAWEKKQREKMQELEARAPTERETPNLADNDKDTNGNTTEAGNANVLEHTTGIQKKEDDSPSHDAPNDADLKPVMTTEHVGNPNVQIQVHGDGDVPKAGNANVLEQIAGLQEKEDDSSSHDEANNADLKPIMTTERIGYPSVQIQAHGDDDVHNGDASTSPASDPVHPPTTTTEVPKITITSSDDDEGSDTDTVAASDMQEDDDRTRTHTGQDFVAATHHIPIDEMLVREFGNRHIWLQVHQDAVTQWALKRKLVLVLLCQLACLHNHAAPRIQERQRLLVGKPLLMVINHLAWVRYVDRFPVFTERVMKYVAWLELLESEYARGVPHWDMFWSAVERRVAPDEGVLEALNRLNDKRLFLHGKILLEEHVVGDLTSEIENTPTWMEWAEAEAEAAADEE
ncbi:hypothetical protein PV08_04641 [Exophiala spinifera]|uniref:Uncharacterized protein n=1 Tax=Exophiala spinifera TaxID=91928 RepID=A0A0D1ZXS5_9EURO|nr:uncharacterized protein PV08_04641 [Exophiala spinifera]KIW17447.1 hypothetical protein PV08_04641 [Exophiala spinifera]